MARYGPPYENHDWDEEDASEVKLDGPSVNDAERCNYDIATVMDEVYRCRRENCDATMRKTHTFAFEDLESAVGCDCDRYEDELPSQCRIVDARTVETTCPHCGATGRVEARDSLTDENGYACNGKPPRYDPR